LGRTKNCMQRFSFFWGNTLIKINFSAQECQDPGIPLNGFRSGDNLQFPHTIEFSCAPGFNLIGSAQRMCTSVGEWSGDLYSI